MSEKLREYFDRYREVMSEYYDLCEKYEGSAVKMRKQLKKLIEKDPNFLDTYVMTYYILKDEGKLEEAEKVLNEAYERAIKLITDKSGNWPDRLEWVWLENRHIIRAILNKAVHEWENENNENAIELFRKLLRTNPNDNAGVRFYILAIRMGMTFEDFEKRFDKGGFYDMDLADWFGENYRRFPDEFEWWEKEIENLE